MSIKTSIHIEQVLRNKMLNPNPFKISEEEFETAKEIAKSIAGDLHVKTGHSIDLACSTVLFLYEALLEERIGKAKVNIENVDAST